MGHSLRRALVPSSPLPSMPRQNKVILQRQYREKEGECFNILRDLINDLTGEDLQKRREILWKAIDLLLAASEIMKSREAQHVHSIPDELPSSTFPEGTTSGRAGYSAELSCIPYIPREHWQSWQSTVEFSAQSADYISQTHAQHYQYVANLDPALDEAGTWSTYF